MTPKKQSENLATEIVEDLIKSFGGLHEWPASQKQMLIRPVALKLLPLFQVAAAAQKECDKFNFPDEDRPLLHDALQNLKTS